jgi:hypothetical protein
MSVFDLPRLHFRGIAVTRLPTGPRYAPVDLAGNQALTDEGPFPLDRPVADYHAYLDQRGPRYDAAGRGSPDGLFSASKGWNFGGNGHFWINAAIVSAEGPEGVDVTDPVVGRAVDMWGHYNEYLATTANRARVFDVDPTSNWTTTLMVGQFCFGRIGRTHDTGYLVTGGVSGMHPPRWYDPRHILAPGDHVLAPEMARSTVYQFVVPADDGLAWSSDVVQSPITTALREAVESPDVDGLVVQFALTNMAPPVAPDAPDLWDLRGTVAPWRRQEARTYPAGRLLTPRRGRRASGSAGLRNLTALVGSDRATLNMITAVPVTGRTGDSGLGPTPSLGSRLDLGDLELRTAQTDRLIARIPAPAYLGPDYDLTSGLVSVPTEGVHGDVDEPLCLIGTVQGDRVVLLGEEEINLQVDDACVFLEPANRSGEPDARVEVEVRSFVRGRPAAVDAVHVRQFVNPRSRPLDPLVSTSRAADVRLVWLRGGRRDAPGDDAASATTSTDGQGRGWFTLRGAQAGGLRLLLTSRADDVPGDPDAAGSAAAVYDNDDALGYWSAAGSVAVRVLPDDAHLDEVSPEEVDFDLVYREVFASYELLYSFMRAEVFSLEDECKVKTYPRLIWQMCDPGNRMKTYYMPPMRDMSQARARLLLQFMRNQQAVSTIPVLDLVPRRTTGGITRRGQLWTALKWAATLELAVMLQYLYAAYSIPTYGAGREHVARGLWTPDQLRLACGDGDRTLDRGIRGTLLNVAREEMIHFLLVNNIIMAMGESFFVPVIDFGSINSTLPVPMDFCLEPLHLGSVQRFIAVERPQDQIGELRRKYGPPTAFDTAAGPEAPVYSTLSELYDDIREGLQRVPDLFMVEKYRGGGEHHLFLRREINAVHPDYQLEVDDLSSALFAIDVVTEQGEGNKLGSEPAGESHFDTFLRVSDVLMREQQEQSRRRPAWTPAYPCVRNPTLREGNANTELISDPETRAVLQLFNRSYSLVLQLMVQHFGSAPDSSLRRSKLMNSAIDVMTGMMSPLGEVLTTLPSGRRGRTAGPSFELDDVPTYNSRPDVAMRSLALRFEHLAAAAAKCGAVPGRVADVSSFYAQYLRDLAPRR